MPRFEPLPDRRPAIVAGASSGSATPPPSSSPAAASRSRSARVVSRSCQELVGKIRADGGEAVGFHLDVTDADSVKSFVAPGHRRARRDRAARSQAPATPTSAELAEISTDEFDSQLQIHLVGANRLATAVLPGMLERQRGDLIFVGSDVALRQRPHMGAYGAAKAALVAMVTNLQMELEGTGVRASIVHPGPTKTDMGWSLPAELIGPALEDWAKWGQARHDYFLRASGSRTGDRVRRRDAARRLHRQHGTPAGGAACRRAKERQQLNLGRRGDAVMTTAIVPARFRRRRRARPPRGVPHRPDRADEARPRRMRRRRLVPAGRQARHLPVRRRGQRVLLPLRRRRSRPGRGLPVHDADLRRGRGVRRQPRAAQGDAAQLGAAR